MGSVATIFCKTLAAMLSEKRDRQENNEVDMLPLHLLPACIMSIRELDLQTCLEMHAVMCEPVDLQLECPSMNSATFFKHCNFLNFTHPYTIVLDCKFLDYFSQ